MQQTRLLAALALAVSPLAFALPAAAEGGLPAGMYMGGAFGATFAEDADLSVPGGFLVGPNSVPSQFNGQIDTDTGYAAFATIGHKWENGIRFELEFGSRKTDIGGITPGSGTGDSISAISMFGNLLYDFDLGFPVTPYVGVGIGGVHLKAANLTTPNGVGIGDDDNVVAGQGIIGLGYMATPSLQLFIDYRYLHAQDPEFRTNLGNDADSEYRNHTISVGLRYSFNEPAPVAAAAPPPPPPPPPPKPAAQTAPPPPPPPPIPREYLVFFDFDSSKITPEAESVLKTVAMNVPKAKAQAIRAVGHADRSGPDRYNQRLSLRRAEAVKKKLIELGVPANEISIEGRGETDPLVPTADGAREPQNRRVQILLQ